MTSKPILLLFGSGARVGETTTAIFSKAGYRVARVSRSLKSEESTSDILNVPGDLNDPTTVENVFATVREQWGEPSVVVYNGMSTSPACTNGFCVRAGSQCDSLFQDKPRRDVSANTSSLGRKPDGLTLPLSLHVHRHLRPNG